MCCSGDWGSNFIKKKIIYADMGDTICDFAGAYREGLSEYNYPQSIFGFYRGLDEFTGFRGFYEMITVGYPNKIELWFASTQIQEAKRMGLNEYDEEKFMVKRVKKESKNVK
jgi:hypothetical protein